MRRDLRRHPRCVGHFRNARASVECLHQLREELNPGRVICWFNFGGLVPHERVMRSMQLFSEAIKPHV